jgi:hypothetical protein
LDILKKLNTRADTQIKIQRALEGPAGGYVGHDALRNRHPCADYSAHQKSHRTLTWRIAGMLNTAVKSSSKRHWLL